MPDNDNDPYLNAAFIKSMHAKVEEMRADLASTAAATRENTDAIKQMAKDTRGIVDTFSALEGGFKVLSGIGRVAKPIFYIVSACGAVLGLAAAWKGVFK